MRKWLRNLCSAKLEVLKWCYNHSQSPVFGVTDLVHQNRGKKDRYRICFFCSTYQYIVEILSRKKKKICHIHFKSWFTVALIFIPITNLVLYGWIVSTTANVILDYDWLKEIGHCLISQWNHVKCFNKYLPALPPLEFFDVTLYYY